MKWGFQLSPSPSYSQISATHVSLMVAVENNTGKDSPSVWPYHILPKFHHMFFTHLKLVLLLKNSHPLLITFLNPISFPPPSLSTNPFLLSYLPRITRFQNDSFLVANFQQHLLKRTMLRVDKLLLSTLPFILVNTNYQSIH